MATNFVDGTTPLDAIAFNGIENEIAENSDRIDDLESALGGWTATYFNFSASSRTFEFAAKSSVAFLLCNSCILAITTYSTSMYITALVSSGSTTYERDGMTLTLTATGDCRGFLLTR